MAHFSHTELIAFVESKLEASAAHRQRLVDEKKQQAQRDREIQSQPHPPNHPSCNSTKSRRKNRNRKEREKQSKMSKEGVVCHTTLQPYSHQQPNLGSINRLKQCAYPSCTSTNRTININTNTNTKPLCRTPCTTCGWIVYCSTTCEILDRQRGRGRHSLMNGLTCASFVRCNVSRWKVIKDTEASVLSSEPGNLQPYLDIKSSVTSVLQRVFVVCMNLSIENMMDAADEKIVVPALPGTDDFMINVLTDYLKNYQSPCTLAVVSSRDGGLFTMIVQGPLDRCFLCNQQKPLVACLVCRMIDTCGDCAHVPMMCPIVRAQLQCILARVTLIECNVDIVKQSVNTK